MLKFDMTRGQKPIQWGFAVYARAMVWLRIFDMGLPLSDGIWMYEYMCGTCIIAGAR